jgi:hypothetical protein
MRDGLLIHQLRIHGARTAREARCTTFALPDARHGPDGEQRGNCQNDKQTLLDARDA